MSLFRAKSSADLETVAAKLHTAREALAAIEQELRERALDAALSDDPAAAMAPIAERVRRGRELIETLENAETEAQRRENKRLAEARAAAERSRIKAVQAHASSVVRAARDLRHATERQVSAYQEMCKAAGKIEKVLHPAESKQLFGFLALRLALDQHVALECARLGIPRSDSTDPKFPTAPTTWGSFGGIVRHGQAVHAAAPIDELLRAKFADIGPFLSGERPAPPPPVEPTPEENAMAVYHRNDAAVAARAEAAWHRANEAAAAARAAEESPAEAIARYHAAVAEIEAPPVVELSAEDQTALDKLLEPPAPVSAAARGLAALTAGRE